MKALMMLALVAIAGCDVMASSVLVRREMQGLPFDPPLQKPSFVAPSTTGKEFDFRAVTDNGVALLFFGYTYCPDICPAHMHNLAAVLGKLPDADARRIHIVFVTTDPERDTIERLTSWLGGIHPRIIGVRPTVEEAQRIQTEVGIQPAMVFAPKPGRDGNYEVGHGAQVIAFTPDNLGRYAYASGTRQTDWASDIPRLLRLSRAR